MRRVLEVVVETFLLNGGSPGQRNRLLRKQIFTDEPYTGKVRFAVTCARNGLVRYHRPFAEHGAYSPRIVTVCVQGSAFLELDFELC
jgi:hypothetical protein